MSIKPKNSGFFDEQFRLEKLSKQNDPLEKLNAHIDFEFFRKPLDAFALYTCCCFCPLCITLHILTLNTGYNYFDAINSTLTS